MELTTQDLNDFCERLESLEGDKKAIADEINDSIETMAENLELDKKVGKKAIKKFYKEWKEAKKDKAEYTEVDYVSDQLLCKAIPEFATEDAVKEEE